jgi:hypothetical protein
VAVAVIAGTADSINVCKADAAIGDAHDAGKIGLLPTNFDFAFAGKLWQLLHGQCLTGTRQMTAVSQNCEQV